MLRWITSYINCGSASAARRPERELFMLFMLFISTRHARCRVRAASALLPLRIHPASRSASQARTEQNELTLAASSSCATASQGPVSQGKMAPLGEQGRRYTHTHTFCSPRLDCLPTTYVPPYHSSALLSPPLSRVPYEHVTVTVAHPSLSRLSFSCHDHRPAPALIPSGLCVCALVACTPRHQAESLRSPSGLV